MFTSSTCSLDLLTISKPCQAMKANIAVAMRCINMSVTLFIEDGSLDVINFTLTCDDMLIVNGQAKQTIHN